MGHIEATKLKMSLTRKGRKHTAEWNAKIALAHKGKHLGKKLSEETKNKISKSLIGNTRAKGRKLSEEAKIKIGLVSKGNKYCLGRKLSEEHKTKLRLSHLGIPRTEEVKRKISLAQKGVKKNYITSFVKGHKISNTGRTHFKKGHKMSVEIRKQISEKLKGENSYLWKGGISKENSKIRNSIETKLWREAVFARDNWTCQKYGIRGGKLHPHHILNFSSHKELRFAIDNGITFSIKAHNKFHKKYGYKDNTKEQIEEFIGRKL